MPALNESNVRHLLRRTEFVDRSDRVAELLALGSVEAAVDNILDVDATPPSVSFTENEPWQKGQELVAFWLDRMAQSPRPMQEKMALFWHGHFCSSMEKINSGELMREQIDLFRRDGLGSIRDMAITMSKQVAMLRYLDNNRNRKDEPNQNFARELMELFLLGVGNYNEADVEAGTAAWTGHTDDWRLDENAYRWEADWHDASNKQFLGRTINTGNNWQIHGDETITVMLGDGVVPNDADVTANRGRRTRDVAAEFLSRKLWGDFAGSSASNGMINRLRSALVAADFEAKPWVRSMLTSDEFYSTAVKEGLVRQPADWMVAVLVAIGAPAADAAPLWLQDSMGQRVLYPPNVSGWRPNGYFVNPSAMNGRARASQGFGWHASETYWRQDGTGYIQLARGRLTQRELLEENPDRTTKMSNAEVVDRALDLMDLQLRPSTRQRVIAHLGRGNKWDRDTVLLAILLTPDMHVA